MLKKNFLCNFQIFSVFCRGGGSAFTLLLAMCLISYTLSAQSSAQCLPNDPLGDTNCRQMDCTNLKLVIEPIYGNVATTCNADIVCAGDRFTQLFYRVKLRYEPTIVDPNKDDLCFVLGYANLGISLRMKANNLLGGPTFSNIDETAILDCYENGPGANWGNTANENSNVAIFEVLPQTNLVNIDFTNNFVTNFCLGDIIQFSFVDNTVMNQPDFSEAELFTIVVNAYPGESISIESILATYDRGGFGGSCDLPVTLPTPIIVDAPVQYIQGGHHSNLLLKVENPIPLPNGECEVPIILQNNNNFNVKTNYVEFVVKVSEFIDKPIGNVSFESTYISQIKKIGGHWFLHFKLNTLLTLKNNSISQLGKVKISPSPAYVSNQAWQATVSLVDNSKSRGKSFPQAQVGIPFEECSTIPMDMSVISCNGGNNDRCPLSLPIAFKIMNPENTSQTCTALKTVKVGLYSTDPLFQSLLTRRLSFSISFDLSDGASITGANLGELSYAPYPSAPSSCFPPLEGNGNNAFYRFTDNTFTYCMDVPSNLAPKTINLTNDGGLLTILFNSDGCINNATLNFLDFNDNVSSTCVPVVDALVSPYGACKPQLIGKIYCNCDVNGSPSLTTLEEAEVNLLKVSNNCSTTTPAPLGNCPKETKITSKNGIYGFCPCFNCTETIIKPTKDFAPLNGVSTYDLVVISKHIQSIELLNSPYKMIAADANKSNSITGLDIVEIRKLILGIYNQLPLAPSWRFVPKDHVFPDPTNPFTAPFPEDVIIPSGVTNKEADFIGIKVGDVNWSASTGNFANKPKTLSFGTPAFAAKGSVVTIPVTYTGKEALCAMQMGLRFDPKKLKLISPSKGDIEGWNAGCFGLTRADQGEIRTLWLPTNGNFEHAIAPGKVLFHLSFRVLEDLPEQGLPIQLDDAVLNNAAWYSKGEEFSLQVGEAEVLDRDRDEKTAPVKIKAECVPNPFAEAAVLSITSNYTGRGRLILFDAYGQLIERQELWLEKGEQLVPLDALAKQPNGVYRWSLLTPEERLTGHAIKQ